GEAFLFGRSVRDHVARERLGFLPENPYVYPYLTPREFVELCGRLSGMHGRALRTRAQEGLGQVGRPDPADPQGGGAWEGGLGGGRGGGGGEAGGADEGARPGGAQGGARPHLRRARPGPDGLLLDAHPERRRGDVRPGRDLARGERRRERRAPDP